MKKKYKKFHMMFDKRFKNLILCSNLNCDGRVDLVVPVYIFGRYLVDEQNI